MNGNFFPSDINKTDLYNFQIFYNPSVIQFYHRISAYLLIFVLLILNFLFYTNSIELRPILILNLAIFFQVILGIVTLITGVKIYYASLHQLGSVFVLISFINILYKNTN